MERIRAALPSQLPSMVWDHSNEDVCDTATLSLEVKIISFSEPHRQKWAHISVIRTKTSETGLSLSQTAALDHDSTAQAFCQKR